ncbi:hypothetical protein ACFL14_02070 [Patescibacteria group bacterium]
MNWKLIGQNILKAIKQFFQNSRNYFWIMFVLAIVLNLFVWYLWQQKIILEFRYVFSPITIENISEDKIQYIVPALGSFFSLINLLLAIMTLKKVRLAAYFLVGASILIEFLILILLRFYLIN